MTKSQNTKNEQQKDLCITSEQLTEQWKKGELPEGHYYIKTRSETTIDEYIQWYKDHGIPSEKSFAYFNVQQVLAPVPPYEVYKELIDGRKLLREYIKDITNENAQLKELLKECVKMNTRLENALWQWNEESELYDENEALENKINEVLK